MHDALLCQAMWQWSCVVLERSKTECQCVRSAPRGLWPRSPHRPSVRKYALLSDGRSRLALQMFGLHFVYLFILNQLLRTLDIQGNMVSFCLTIMAGSVD